MLETRSHIQKDRYPGDFSKLQNQGERFRLYFGMSNQKKSRVSDVQLIRNASSRDEDPTYWLRLSASERVELAWDLSQETWSLANPETDFDESGLCRSTAKLIRR